MQVDELPADAAMAVCPLRSPVMVVDLVEFTELFDVDVKEFAGRLAFAQLLGAALCTSAPRDGEAKIVIDNGLNDA